MIRTVFETEEVLEQVLEVDRKLAPLTFFTFFLFLVVLTFLSLLDVLLEVRLHILGDDRKEL